MTILDHLFIFIVAVVYPVSGYFSFRRLKRRIAAGEPVNRSQLYNLTFLGHWALFAVAVIIWQALGRSWPDLGFSLAMDAGFLAGAIMTVVAIAYLVAQLRQVVAAGADELRKFKAQIGSVEIIVPHNGNELGRFYGLAVTAGIVEETLWRGFMIWYLVQFMPVWAAAAVSALGFGIAHAYQGAANIPRITAVGIVFAILYLVSGSLWLPIVLHAAIDLLQGRTAYEVIHRAGSEDSPDDVAEAASACR